MADIKNIIAARPRGTTGVFVAPAGTALPTDTSTPLDVAYVGLGHAGEDGLSFPPERSTEDIKNWGGDTVYSVQTDFSQTFTVTLQEALNADVLKAVYGDDNVTTTAATAATGTLNAVKINSKTLPRKVWAFEGMDGDKLVRIVVPHGQVTEVGEPTMTHSGITQYQLTIKAYPDENNDNAHMFTDDGVFSGV